MIYFGSANSSDVFRIKFAIRAAPSEKLGSEQQRHNQLSGITKLRARQLIGGSVESEREVGRGGEVGQERGDREG